MATQQSRLTQVFQAIGADVKAILASISAKVANNLTASTTVAPSTTAVNTALALKLDLNLAIQANTASYTLVLANNGKTITQNVAVANGVTIPQNSSAAFPIGTTIPIIQLGVGQTTIGAGTGTTILTRMAGLKMGGQNAVAFITKVATNTWIAGGDLVA